MESEKARRPPGVEPRTPLALATRYIFNTIYIVIFLILILGMCHDI